MSFSPEHIGILLVVLVIAVIFLGPKRLPEAGKSLGQAIRGFRNETKGLHQDVASVKEEVRVFHSDVAGSNGTVTTTVSEPVAVPIASVPAASAPVAPTAVAAARESNA